MISTQLKLATAWLCAAMSEWDKEMVPCIWEIVTDEHNETVTVEWVMAEMNDDGEYTPANHKEKHVDVYTFAETLAAVEAAKPVYEKHKDDLAMYFAFEIAVQIIRASKSN